MTTLLVRGVALLLLVSAITLHAQVPQLINYQGRVAVGAVNFDGSGQFKFALVNASGTTTYWSNDGTSNAGTEPTAAVALTVTKGLYSVLLGDATLPNMTAVSASVFNNADVRLRVWFNDGTNGAQLLTPDQRIASVGYAVMAGNVPDGAITSAKMANGAVTSTQLAANAVQAGNIAAGSVGSAQMANGAVGTSQIAVGAVQAANIAVGAVGSTQIAAGAVTGDAWSAIPSNALTARTGHTMVWTGSEVIVWGGLDGVGPYTVFSDGARYNPVTKTWAPVASASAPSARYAHTAVWTGTQMIIWGGYDISTNTYLGDGARYTPSTNTWTPLPSANAPSIRWAHTAVWTGSEMIVWGGANDGDWAMNHGARYDPAANTWTATNTAGSIGHVSHSSVWTGTEMIVWGGWDFNDFTNTGARYNPTTGIWTPITTTGAPAPRVSHQAVWTGTEMILWGGASNGVDFEATYQNYSDGARYNPANNTWTALPLIGTPSAREQFPAVWTGTEMIVWGGTLYNASNSSLSIDYNDGGRYSPATNTWRPVELGGAPVARDSPTVVWTGGELIVWGGFRYNTATYYNDGGSLAGRIPVGSIGTAQLASNAVQSGNIANGAVSAAQLGSGAVGSTHLSDGGVTAVKIGSGHVVKSLNSLTDSVTLAAGSNISITPSGSTLTIAASLTGVTHDATTLTGAGTGASPLAVANGGIGSAQLAPTFGVSGTITAGSLALPATTSASVGVLNLGGTRILHGYGTGNFFAGAGAGNFTMTGANNTVTGFQVLNANTTGWHNTAMGYMALHLNTTGYNNTASGFETLYKNVGGDSNTATGVQALYSNSSGSSNTASGFQALFSNDTGQFNVASGRAALASNTTGSNNTATGTRALEVNTEGVNNTATGYHALRLNTTGYNNTASGVQALYKNLEGESNTASGMQALYENTNGSSNTASGLAVLANNTLGSLNTASGREALFRNTTGSSNTAVGRIALYNTQTGHHNTSIGAESLGNLTSGDNNLALGYQTGVNLTSGSGNVYIASVGAAAEDKTIRIGGQGYHTAAYIAAISGVPVTGGVAVYVKSDGQLGYNASSRRFKFEIENMGDSSEAIHSLRPVSFRYKPEIDPMGIPQFGLIAEEVDKIAPELVVRDDKGVIQTVRYEQVNAMLLNEFLKQHQRVADHEKSIAAQQKQIEALAARLDQLSERLNQSSPPRAQSASTKE